MSIIQIKNLTFAYPVALEPVFSNVNLDLDTSWRLGLIGRNGRGKTTFLNLLLGNLKGQGSIYSHEQFEYFPVAVQQDALPALTVARGVIAPFDEWERLMAEYAAEGTDDAMLHYGDIEQLYAAADGYIIDESIAAEAGRLGVTAEALQRPFNTLSGGEKVKLLLAALFLKKHRFLLIDEPTDHLDAAGRESVARWLAGKQGFILVSHDRKFLNASIDHVLSINRADIELQKGNYDSWRHNRTLQDDFEKAENAKLESSIARLEAAAKRTGRWSDQIEKSKNSSQNATYNRGAASVDRGYIGHQAARMMQRSKAIERRRGREVEQKKELLKNVEEAEALKFQILPSDKTRLLTAEKLSFGYDRPLFEGLSFQLDEGERIAVTGHNGSGKSSLLKLVTGALCLTGGTLRRYGGLVISTLPQETDFLHGSLRAFAAQQEVDESLFLAILRKLDFEREAFGQDMGSYSAGQKKKVCLAASLATPAHLFVWDEPLNYVDVISREQIERAALQSAPSMLFVEHDAAFVENVATRTIDLR